MDDKYLKTFDAKIKENYDEASQQLRRTSSMPSVKCIHNEDR